MLPARNYKKCLIKPLPLDKIVITKSPTVQVSLIDVSLTQDSNNNSNIVNSYNNKRRQSVPREDDLETSDSPLDYTIDESDDEDKISYHSSQLNISNEARKSFTSMIQRNMATPPSNLKDLLKPSPLEFVKKRKRKPQIIPLAPLTPTKAYDGIDESSPIKKVKGNCYADQSCIFINRNRKCQHSKRQDKVTNSSHLITLVDQMKDLMEREKTARTIWRHSVTSQLKNKFKEMVKGKDTITLQLSNFSCKFHCGFADGSIIETTVENTFTIGETVQLIFPSLVCESMGLANGLTIRLISPWNVISINNQRFVLNPFWISVVKRGEVNQDKSKRETTSTSIIEEETIIQWTCPCQQSLGAIDPLDCNLALSQRSSLSQTKSQC